MTSMAAPTSTVVHIIQRLHGSSASSVPPSVRQRVCLTRVLHDPRQTEEKEHACTS